MAASAVVAPPNSAAAAASGAAPVTRTARIMFTGTGTSEGVPRVTCLSGTPGRTPPDRCWVCEDAVKPGSKNRRSNTGIVCGMSLVCLSGRLH
jgi:hypothetical protein